MRTRNPKFPRTYHLPWSHEIHSDDKEHSDISALLNKPLTITVKMDGSNVGMSKENLSSRSGEIPKHQSFNLLKQIYSNICYSIPSNIIVYSEWLYAIHSIEYKDLSSYLMAFASKNDRSWMSWKDTVKLCKRLSIHTVPVIKKSIEYSTAKKLKLGTTEIADCVISKGHEGIVIRLSSSFNDYTSSTAKLVRKGHVQTNKHWSNQRIRRNIIK